MNELSANEFYEKASSQTLSVIDVREPDEFAAGHIAGSFNLPLSQLADRYAMLDQTKAHYIICQKGGRSARACEFLENHGYQVTNVQGGLEAYPAEGID
ncbi:rhodanese-like domain-containing protein [Streptococcus panodentis]|uniref:Rhodanese-like domain-containing protein n=1 Tax=Streptococcus panodentis TaxID=1581472 RepID=A0ABS5AYU8_9STRE|nr:rhodanese-like domain-containing protein [Streptococcus panodentis]MBP2621757.1 rhodanese-like domain-containing protein [Streptococcus panodentis]